MANTCLGIYIDEGLIKYAKLQRDKDNVRVETFNIVFYDNLERELNKIISETGSSKLPISVNISKEMYNYFEVLALLTPKDRTKMIKMDFGTICDENGMQASDYETRTKIIESENNSDKLVAIHVSTEKEEISRLAKMLVGKKINELNPISTSIVNLLDVDGKENFVIVNLEMETKITTIVDGELKKVDILPTGMKDILNAINETENSMRKSYEVCKNTTIYTQGTDAMIETDENEHLEEIMPVLYNIVQQTKEIIEDCPATIHKIYITGLGSAINNIELYFQEFATNSKCEILKPFFLENTSLNTSFKDYIEVNSAIALALDGVGYESFNDAFNFKKGNNSFSTTNINLNPEINMDMKGPLVPAEKVMLRISAILGIMLVTYILFTNYILNKIDDMKVDAENKIASVTREINNAEGDIQKVKAQADHYAQVSEVLKNLVEENQQILDSVPEIRQMAIPNMLKSIANEIPINVKLLSIKNTESTHIVIEAISPEYEEIGFLKALLSTQGILKNVKSSSGERIPYVSNGEEDEEDDDDKNKSWIYVTIEGDLQ